MKPVAIHYLRTILPAAQEAGKECGYAVALYAVTRNLELFAVPWTENAKSGTDLVEAICEAVSGTTLPPVRQPHGRVRWPIHLGCGSFLELSVLPRDACSACEGTGVMDGDETASAGSILREAVACPECSED